MSNSLQKFILTTLTLAIAFTVPSFGQLDDPLAPTKSAIPFYFGPVIGYNKVLHSADLSTFNYGEVPCPVFQNGSANGYFFGISFEYLLGGAKDSKSSIIARLLYNSMPASFEVAGDEYPSVAKRTGLPDTTIFSSTEHKNEVIYNMITFEAQYKLNLFDTQFGVVVGPTFDFAMQKDQNQTYALLTPDYAKFNITTTPEEQAALGISYSDDGRTLIVKEGEIPNSNALRVGIKFGVQYEILLAGGFYIVPSFNYNFGVTNLSSVDDWRVSALQLGIDVRFPSTIF
ncbi:MAG: hypothetical protein CVV25_04100 [Ignavibacteriae bacterium HGW-Ignavibacteriae-4]|jgi:hypothetical protein|nr:MAG: hypothetical protein CVV25_04100 [Ignavibacteriae bacterium HGW-Ignavibacteriae-4]